MFAKKELGQNFLKDIKAIKLMVEEIVKEDTKIYIEIGPGLGAVTKNLLSKLTQKQKLYAIEFDPRCVQALKTDFKEYSNFELINENILDYLPRFKTQEKFNIVGSLPYYITSPILHKIIYMENKPAKCILLVQKEVAKKISSEVPDASYLSTFVQTFYSVSYLATVDREMFEPVPKVDGGIIKLELKKDVNTVITSDIRKYEGYLHKGFATPRKMVHKVFDKDLLKTCGITSTARPQHISLDQWLKLFEVLNH